MKFNYLTFFLIILVCLFLTKLQAQENISVLEGNADNGLPAHIFTWSDSKHEQRQAVIVDQRPAGAGYLRKFTYKVAGVDRVCRGSGLNGHEGDGYIQNHTGYGGDFSSHLVSGTTSQPLNGKHHSIIDFYMPNYVIEGPEGKVNTVPSRIQWFFATGRSYPIFSLTQDARATEGNIGADSRSPYGDFHYDGNTDYQNYPTGDYVGGASWGDTHKWVSVNNGTTDESIKITSNSGWRYDDINTIPYAMQWTSNVNAEMGHVLTQPISVKDMGRDPSPKLGNIQNINGPMIEDEQWAFQILNYGIIDATGGQTKRLTWGTNWGYPGGFDDWGNAGLNIRQFTKHSDGLRSDGMLLAYSVFVVLGEHTGGYTDGATGLTVKQMENMQLATLTASVGTIRTSGPAGVGLASSPENNINYAPEGYNHIFATWEANADANIADITFSPGLNAPIENPIFVINNFTASALNQVSINNVPVAADVDYYATIDQANSKVWITINKTVTNPMRLHIDASPSTVANNEGVEIKLFPNPSTGKLILKLEDINAEGMLEIYNVLGEKVFQSDIINQKSEINLNLSSGAYFYFVKNINKQFISSGKLIIQ